MLKQNLITALRHLGRQKLNTALHIIGLTIGISVCLLVTLFLQYEMSFDSYHEKAERTYRVISKWTSNEEEDYHFSTPFPLANAIRNEVTGIEQVAFAHPVYSTKIVEVSPQKRFLEDRILAIEPEFLDVFQLEPIKGDLQKVLHQPYQAILTETQAKKFFGDEEPIGKTFSIHAGEKFEFTVSAIIKDLPTNTHLPVSIFVSYVYSEKFLKPNLDGWSYVSGTETLIVVPEQVDINNIKKQLKAIADKHINNDEALPKNFRSDFDLQLLTDVHFNAAYGGGGEWVKAISVNWLWFFASIGIAVLLLACINFMNLSTAQALARAKEVGVRKSIGAGRLNLIGQFLLEAWILTFIAGILSVALAQLLLPAINTFLEKGIVFNPLQSPLFTIALISGVFLLGLLAGLYPAFVIARFNPASSLKGGSKVAGDHGSVWVRQGLVIAQFTISVGMLMAVILISQQVSFLRGKNLGFNKENIINVEIPERVNKHDLFRAELEKNSSIKAVSFATATPSNNGHWGTIMNRTNRDDPNRKEVTLIFADAEYCKMYGFKLLAGRFIEAADSNSISKSLPEAQQIMKAVVNEKLIHELNFKSNEAAIGERMWIGWNSGNVEIVGVVTDFNTASLQEGIKPTLITQSPHDYSQAGIKLEAGSDLPIAIASIEAVWKATYPEGIFSYKFLDQQIDAFYKSEERLFTLFKVFSAMAMLISCLGLWGLAAYAAQSRTKEIGIRKVMGASVNNIVLLLSRDLLILVLVALVIATPLSWYGINQWLQNYAYRMEIGYWVFGLAGALAILIALITVSSQAFKAAVTNPVDSLRSE